MPTFPPPPLQCGVSQLFQGKVSAAVITGNRAVDLSQRDEDNTPDTEVVGQVSTCRQCFGVDRAGTRRLGLS